jgi:hypothetical protein
MIRAALLALTVLFAGTANAQTVQTAYAGQNAVVLTIPVTASIGGRCGFADGAAPSGSYHKDNFDRDGLAAQFDFSLNCTGPSRVAVASTNGGLLTSAAVQTGYANKADYSVTLNLVANNGSQVQATCAASTLAGTSGCAFAGKASTTQGLQLASSAVNQPGSYVRISAPKQSGSAVLVAGTYSDSLTITVSPAL